MKKIAKDPPTPPRGPAAPPCLPAPLYEQPYLEELAGEVENEFVSRHDLVSLADQLHVRRQRRRAAASEKLDLVEVELTEDVGFRNLLFVGHLGVAVVRTLARHVGKKVSFNESKNDRSPYNEVAATSSDIS